MSPKPVFIIGAHRSGTSWLSNLLAAVPGIYAPTHVMHRGVHESAFFSHLVKYCNFGRDKSDLLAIKYLFEKSDFFLLTGQETGPDIVEHGYAKYFRLVMDAAATERGASHWLEKTPSHTLFAKFLLERFPDATLIAVTRNYRKVVQSKIYGFGKPDSFWQWFRQSVVTAVYEKVISNNSGFVVSYEDLQTDRSSVVQQCLKRLGMDPALEVSAVCARNSSFDDRPPQIEWWQNLALVAGRLLVVIWPAAFIEELVLKWQTRSGAKLPGWFFLIQASK